MIHRRKVINGIMRHGPRINQEQGLLLQAPYLETEVKRVIFDIPNNKTPGSDGFSSSFYKSCWDIVGEDVSKAIVSFLNSGKLLKEVNNTTITLIPKVICPGSVKDFKPISCCNVLYKAATKLICSRLRRVLVWIS